MDNFWQECLAKFKGDFDATTFGAFLETTSLRRDGDTLFLVSPNKATQRWLEQNIEKPLREMIKGHFDGGAPTLSYAITGGKTAQNPPISAKTRQPAKKAAMPAADESGLRKDLVFESFVPGRANEIPLIAAKTLAQGDGNISPLFIYGSTGLGKTHLVQAVGNEYRRLHPQRKVLYTAARSFMNEVVQAFRLNNADRFKERYKALDMLIVDDIQYIGGDKLRTQEEFFFLFNLLHDAGKEIVITCDRAPAYIKDLPTRLTSRFNAGLTTNILPPEYELRADILRQKSAQRGAALAEDIVAFIAENIQSNVRELEGALKRVLAMARFKGAPPSLPLCRSALSDLIGKAHAAVHSETIKEKVAHLYGIRVSDLSSKKRQRSVSRPRHVAIYLCRKMTGMSLPEIGRCFGKRNHTTILHSCRQIESALPADDNLAGEIAKLETFIREA